LPGLMGLVVALVYYSFMKNKEYFLVA